MIQAITVGIGVIGVVCLVETSVSASQKVNVDQIERGVIHQRHSVPFMYWDPSIRIGSYHLMFACMRHGLLTFQKAT
jgi:hypothetical protein